MRHDVRDELLAAYADPGRGYHDTLHLTEVLDRLDELAAAGEEFDRTTWSSRRGSTTRSTTGRRAPRRDRRSGPSGPSATPEVARLVRLTEHHRPDEGDANGRALSDADLAILAADAERYADYTASVRREYAHVSDADFAVGRALVLRDLLAKPTLFQTAHGAGGLGGPGARQRARRAGSSALGLAAPQTGAHQPADQLARGHRHSAGLDQPVVELVGHVVVVALEAPGGDAVRGGEVVELVVRRVAHQVRPEPPVGRHRRRVDEDHRTAAPRRPLQRPPSEESSRVRHERTKPAST